MVQVYLGSLAKQPWREKILLRSPTFNQYSYWLKRATLEQTTRIRKNKCFSRTRREAEDEVRVKEVVLAKAKEEASIGITKLTQNFSKKNTMSVSGSASTSTSDQITTDEEWFSELSTPDWPDFVETGDETTHPIRHINNVPFDKDGKKHCIKNVQHVVGLLRECVGKRGGTTGVLYQRAREKGEGREPAACERRYTGTRPFDTKDASWTPTQRDTNV